MAAPHRPRPGARRLRLHPRPDRAAAEAQRVSANAEAVRLLERVLELLGKLPPTPGRRARELAVLTTLPTLIGQVEGYGSDRVAEVQDRGLELAGPLGVEPEPPLLRSLAIASLVRGDFVGARRVGARLRVGGERDRDAMRVVEGDYVLGIAAFWQGDLEAARGHFEAAVDRYRPEDRPAHLVRYELDPKVICLSRLGNTLWFLGRPAAATRSRDAALALADEVGHPYSRATALVFATLLALELGDADDLRRHATELRAWCRRHQARTIEVPVKAFAGYLYVLDGHPEAGLARIRGALDDSGRPEDAPGLRASILRVLLEAAAAAGDTRGRLSAADLALAPDAGTRLWESEARRHRAEAMGGAVSRADPGAAAVGEREVGFDVSFAAGWAPGDPDGERHTAWVRAGWEALRPHSAGVYVNFLSDEGAAGLRAAYGDRLQRLTALKDRWDPANVFGMNANIAPGGRAGARPGR